MNECDKCIHNLNKVRYIGIYKCEINFDTKTIREGTFPIDLVTNKKIDKCLQRRTATIKEAIIYLGIGDIQLTEIWKIISNLNVNCPALIDPYNWKGCKSDSFKCENFNICDSLFLPYFKRIGVINGT